MTIRMASPLYIVRQDCEKDLFAVLRRLAEVGFDGIEFLGFFGHGAKEVRQKLDEFGLAALGNHVPYKDLAADPQTVLDFHQEVGCEYLTVADLPLADFAKVAEGYGCKSYTARTIEELRAALRDSLKQSVSTLIDIKVAPKTMTHGYDGWWNVGVTQAPRTEKQKKALKEREEHLLRARKY